MAQIPKNTKYSKAFKGRIHGVARRGNIINFGKYAIQALEAGRITQQQIEAARRVIVRKMKRAGKVWIRIFPDIPVSSKPAEVRMGKGKGSIDRWICRVKKERILIEIDGVPEELAKRALLSGSNKFPIRSKWVSKDLNK